MGYKKALSSDSTSIISITETMTWAQPKRRLGRCIGVRIGLEYYSMVPPLPLLPPLPPMPPALDLPGATGKDEKVIDDRTPILARPG